MLLAWFRACARPGACASLSLLALTCLVVPGHIVRAAEMAQEYSCVSEPDHEAVLSLSVAGRIERIPVVEGQHVKKGAALVNLESQMEELEVKRRELIWKDKSELDAAEAQEASLKQLLDSTRRLFEETKSVSQEELIKMELDYRSAQADFERLRTAELREEVEYQLAKTQYERRTLFAPFDGEIVEISLQVGESCDPNEELVKLVDISKGYLTCNVEERVGREVKENQNVPIRVATGDTFWQGQGKVVFASPLVDSASGLMRLKISFDNPKGVVRPGVPAFVELGGAP